MNGIFDRLGAVNPLVWVAIALAAILGYGAQKWVALMKIREDRQQMAVILIKSGALLLAVLIFIYALMTQ
jgi:hypothetical protein